MAQLSGLPVRPLGSQGLLSSAQGLGCMGMSAAYKDANAPANEQESIAVIHKALELGVTHLDTSDMYGPFTNEELVGKAIRGEREKYMLATKFGVVFTPEGMKIDGSKKHVRNAVEASLKRLGIDCIDLYYQHRVDRTVPIEETWTELKALVEEGKVKYLGISEASADEIRQAHAIHPISACQLEWSLWTRNAEADVIPTCRELGIGIVAYSPLGRGMLTGAVQSLDSLDPSDGRVSMHPRFQRDNFASNLLLVNKTKDIAARKGVTPGQLALAWVHAQGEDVFPIPGTKKLKYLLENVAAFHMKLSPADKKELEDVFDGKVVGERYPPHVSKHSFESYVKGGKAVAAEG